VVESRVAAGDTAAPQEADLRILLASWRDRCSAAASKIMVTLDLGLEAMAVREGTALEADSVVSLEAYWVVRAPYVAS
jgi:hypothetical protein